MTVVYGGPEAGVSWPCGLVAVYQIAGRWRPRWRKSRGRRDGSQHHAE